MPPLPPLARPRRALRLRRRRRRPRRRGAARGRGPAGTRRRRRRGHRQVKRCSAAVRRRVAAARRPTPRPPTTRRRRRAAQRSASGGARGMPAAARSVATSREAQRGCRHARRRTAAWRSTRSRATTQRDTGPGEAVGRDELAEAPARRVPPAATWQRSHTPLRSSRFAGRRLGRDSSRTRDQLPLSRRKPSPPFALVEASWRFLTRRH